MRFDRRRFLTGTVASGMAAIAPNLGAVSLQYDDYTNSALGVRLRKPPNWQFASARAFTAAQSELVDRLSRADLERLRQELNGDDPVLVITKRSLRTRGFVPMIHLLVDPISSTPIQFRTLLPRCPSAIAPYFENYRIERELQISELSGFEFGQFTAQYLETIDSQKYTCRLNFYVGMTNRAELTFCSLGLCSGPDECSEQFSSVMQTVQFF
jgi:hypothetical protein